MFRARSKLRRSKHPWFREIPPTMHGMREYVRMGSMAAGSNILTLTFPSTFEVGDSVIVQTGGEAGGGVYNTMGVGGQTEAIFDPPAPPAFLHYWAVDVPKALQTTVTAVSPDGLTLTLAASAVVATTNTLVYFDNQPIVAALNGTATGPGTIIQYPAGRFAMGNVFGFGDHGSGYIVHGAGKDQTIFFMPKGAWQIGFFTFQCHGIEVRDFSLHGHLDQNSWGMGFQFQEGLSYGFLLIDTDNAHFHHLGIKDVFWKGVWASSASNNLNCHDCNVTMTAGRYNYFAEWFFGASDSNGGGTFTRCYCDMAYLTPAFEVFRSDNWSFFDCGGTNCAFSNNASGNFLVDGFDVTVKPFAQYLGNAGGWHRNNPLIQANSNIVPPSPGMELGGIWRNVTVDIQGEINPASGNEGADQITAFNVNEFNPNITIEDCVVTYAGNRGPDIGPYFPHPPRAVNSTAPNTIVNRVTVNGTHMAPPGPTTGPYLVYNYQPDIAVSGLSGQINNCDCSIARVETGTITNTTAESIQCVTGTVSGCTGTVEIICVGPSCTLIP